MISHLDKVAKKEIIKLVYVSVKGLLSSVNNVIYKHIESVYLLCQESFCYRNGNYLLYIICKKKKKK